MLRRIIVAVDPAVSSHDESDETGIVVVGLGEDGHAYVLYDDSGRHGAIEWPNRAVHLFHFFKADKIIGEVNNGGDLVERAVLAVDPNVPFESVHASRGKVLRAEPVAALYEKGRVHHVGRHPKLETQMTEWIPGPKAKSPDRVDALVHGVTALMLSDTNQTRSTVDAYL